MCYIYPLQRVIAAGRLGFLLTYDTFKPCASKKEHHALFIEPTDDIHAFYELLVSYDLGNQTVQNEPWRLSVASRSSRMNSPWLTVSALLFVYRSRVVLTHP